MRRVLLCSCVPVSLLAASSCFAQSPRYVVSLCWMEMFNGVSLDTDTDWLALYMRAPTDERTYNAGPKSFKEDGGPPDNTASRQNWGMVSEPFPVQNNDQVPFTISWSVGNIGTSDRQAAGKAVSDEAEEIGISSGNPISMAVSYIAGTIVGYALQDCDMSLFTQRLIIDGASLNRGLSPPWVNKGKDRWYNVFDYDHIKGKCDEGHYNLEVYIRKIDNGGNVNDAATFAGDQLNKLYVPLDVYLTQGDAEWAQFTNEFRQRFGRSIPLRVETAYDAAGKPYARPVPLTNAEWQVWMNAVFTKFKPRNDKISQIIQDNSALYAGGQTPKDFQEWFAYKEEFDKAYTRATLNPTDRIWSATGYSANGNFPPHLVSYVSNTRKRLEKARISQVAARAPMPPQQVNECDPDPSHFQ